MHTASAHIEELLIPVTSTTPQVGFAELYELHSEAVFRAALRITGRPADAEDVLQTVFLRIMSRGARGGDVEDLAQPAAYFRRAAVNAAVDVLRRREVHAESAYDDLAPHAVVQPPFLLKERLRRAIATVDGDDAGLFLPSPCRGAVDRRAGEDVPDREEQRDRQAPPHPAQAASRNGAVGRLAARIRRCFGR